LDSGGKYSVGLGSSLPLVYLRHALGLAGLFRQDFEGLLAEARHLDAADQAAKERLTAEEE
jgi:hypothetical protein